MVTLHKVVWQDATGGSNMGWRDLEDLTKQETTTIISCGAIIYEDAEKIIVCPHIILEDGEIKQGDAEIAIPRSWIVSNLKMAVFPEGD
jgi:hypothetical protein